MTRSVAVFCAVMLAMAAVLNAAMDTLSFHFDRSVFAEFKSARTWFDPRISWKNKWKDGVAEKGEAFFLSTTALVGLTDAWHCGKSLVLLCLMLAVLAPFAAMWQLRWSTRFAVLIAMHLGWGLMFELLFSKALLR